MNPQQKNDNPYALLIRRMIIIAVAVNAVAAMAWISGIELAGIILGTFAFMISVIIAVLLPAGKKAALRISSLREGNGLLLRWEYTAEPFRNFTVAEYRRQLTNANITAGVLVLAGPVVGLYKDGEEGLLVGIAVGVGLALLAYLLGFLMAKDFFDRASSPPFEALISSSSVYLNGLFADWSISGAQCVSAEIRNDELSGMPSILIVYTTRGRYGKQTKELYVPIPEGKMHEAQQIITQLK